MFTAMLFHTRFCQDLSKKISAHIDAIFKLLEEMAKSSSDESGSENELDEIFGESSDEEDFGGFVFETPDDTSGKRTQAVRPFNLTMRIIHVLHLNVRIVAQLLISCLAVGKRLTFLNFFFPMNF